MCRLAAKCSQNFFALCYLHAGGKTGRRKKVVKQSLLYGVRMVYSYIAERKKGTLAEDRDASKGAFPL